MNSWATGARGFSIRFRKGEYIYAAGGGGIYIVVDGWDFVVGDGLQVM